MNPPKHQNHRKRRTDRTVRTNRVARIDRTVQADQTGKSPNYKEMVHPESTGRETSYLKSLVDSRTQVTVTMNTGEEFQGRIRYYDLDCFSIGLSKEKRKIFLRKDSVSYITEN